MKKILIRIGAILIVIVLSCFTYLYVRAIFDNIMVEKEIMDFVSKGELEYEYSDTVKVYKVYTDEDIEDTIITDTNIILGNDGDIYIMPESRATSFNIINSFISFLFGGHAGIHSFSLFDGGYCLVESMGIIDDSVIVNEANSDKYDLVTEERSVIGIRVKTSYENRKIASDYALSLEGKPYNYSFVFNRENSYYCTDIAARIYSDSDANITIDNTPLYTTAQELILSNETYISYYKYTYNGITYIYHLVKK